MNTALDRGLPASIESERTILGSILLDNKIFDECTELQNEDFSLDSHRTILRTMGKMISEGMQVDTTTLPEYLNRDGQLSSIGGTAYIWSLTENLPRHLSPIDYIGIVKEKSKLRQIMFLGQEMGLRASDGSEKALDILSTFRASLEAILCDSGHEETLVRNYAMQVAEEWDAARNSSDEVGLSYGLPGLDNGTGGLRRGENTTVGGVPGSGKTSLAIQAIVANCSKGIPAFFCSLEMTRTQALHRVFSLVSEVPSMKLRNPRLANVTDAQCIHTSARLVSEWPLHIYDKSQVTLTQLSGMLRFAIRKHKIRLFVVDYAQLIASNGRDMREKVTRAVTEMTAIAKGENVSLLLLSQLARKGREGFNRRPRLDDLKETAAIEESAHCVALIHRPWDEDAGRLMEKAATEDADGCEIIVAKQRSGPTFAFPVEYDGKTLIFKG